MDGTARASNLLADIVRTMIGSPERPTGTLLLLRTPDQPHTTRENNHPLACDGRAVARRRWRKALLLSWNRATSRDDLLALSHVVFWAGDGEVYLCGRDGMDGKP